MGVKGVAQYLSGQLGMEVDSVTTVPVTATSTHPLLSPLELLITAAGNHGIPNRALVHLRLSTVVVSQLV